MNICKSIYGTININNYKNNNNNNGNINNKYVYSYFYYWLHHHLSYFVPKNLITFDCSFDLLFFIYRLITLQDGIKVLQSLLKLPSNDSIGKY